MPQQSTLPYKDSPDRLLWTEQTCSARTQLIRAECAILYYHHYEVCICYYHAVSRRKQASISRGAERNCTALQATCGLLIPDQYYVKIT